MDIRLKHLALARGGVFSASDALRLGLTHTDLSRMHRSGDAVRVRRGAFVLGDVWRGQVVTPEGRRHRSGLRSPTPEDRFRMTVAAVLRARPANNAASHQASLAQHHVDLWGLRLDRVDIAAAVKVPQHESGIRVHPAEGWRCVAPAGVRAVRLDRALVQVAAEASTAAAVCSMDHATQEGWCSVADLRAAVPLVPERRQLRVLRAIDLVDPAAESVGETRTRLLLRDLGYRVRSQVWLTDPYGRRSRVDLVVDDLVVVEFDGLVKYEGLTGRQALADEKSRESGLVDLGHEVVRVVWVDLDGPAGIRHRVDSALARAARRAA